MEIPMYVPHDLSEMAGRRPVGGHRRRSVRGLVLIVILILTWARSSPADGPEPPRGASTLVQVSRNVAQDQGAWVIDYRLRHTGPTGAVVAPEEIAVKVESWVSNSRVASHAVPRRSMLAIAHGPELTAVGEVIAAADEAHRCREKLICQVSVVRGPSSADADCGGPRSTRSPTTENGQRTMDKRAEPLSLAPGGVVHVRLRLEHHHVLFGDYDPLLGVRAVSITLGGATVRDRVSLDREQYLAQPRFCWPEPPEERRDTRHSVAGPDSLHLEAHVPGHHYYRYPDRPVRYGTPMRLRFSYLVAAGTEGECRVRVAQYKDTPTSWRMLNGAGFEKCLKVVGRWTRVEHVFTTDAEATTLALDFRIAGDADIGEMWIDDVSLEPVGCPGHAGP
jgi:hypothetical protein